MQHRNSKKMREQQNISAKQTAIKNFKILPNKIENENSKNKTITVMKD